jgi:formiminoglutamase
MTTIALFGADYSGSSITPSRACEAPAAVRQVLPRYKNLTLDDRGDLGVAQHGWDEAFAAISKASAESDADFTIALGGDHSVTWPLVNGCARKHGGRVGIVQFDIHHDTRSLDAGPSNGTPIRGLIESGVVLGGDVYQIGIRESANDASTTEGARELGVQWQSTETARRRSGECAELVLEWMAECDSIYLTVDIDVLDRSCAPGAPASLAGGLHSHDLAIAVATICRDPRVRAMDIVEFDPTRDVGQMTAHAVANVLWTAVDTVKLRT